MDDYRNNLSQLAEYEEIIRQIKDVISARVVTNDHDEIEEIHVLAGPNRSPKQVVRDIESAFMAQFGISIDHKKISVAQMQDEESKLAVAGLRPKVVSVTLLTSGVRAEAKVQLKIDETVCEGIAAGPNSTENTLRLIVTATLQAIEEYVKGTCNFVVEDVALIPLGRKQAAAVSITLVTPIGEDSLAGIAFLKRDERDAVVKATLSAINRRLALLLSE